MTVSLDVRIEWSEFHRFPNFRNFPRKFLTIVLEFLVSPASIYFRKNKLFYQIFTRLRNVLLGCQMHDMKRVLCSTRISYSFWSNRTVMHQIWKIILKVAIWWCLMIRKLVLVVRRVFTIVFYYYLLVMRGIPWTLVLCSQGVPAVVIWLSHEKNKPLSWKKCLLKWLLIRCIK